MGMEHVIRFPGGSPADLGQVIALLAERNFPIQLRMVDGELTMPGEIPPDGWKEARLGTPSGMVTLVRRGPVLHVVTWGNAGGPMQRAWNGVAWAVAKAGGGQILRPEGLQDPDEFKASVTIPDVLR